MKKVLLVLVVVLCSSCAQTGLYSWKDYQKTSYNYYKKQSPESTAALIATYKKMIASEQTSKRQVVPPGIHAEYGYLLLQNGSKDEGIEQLKREVELYPESGTFVNRIIKLAEK
jgi:hypothetical protein